MQVPALGIAIDVLDPDTGTSIRTTGAPGELVVSQPFPSMPACFWGDDDGSIYRAAYFERFKDFDGRPGGVDVWAQHDWLSVNRQTGGSTMHGRSDGVLNPSGIRFGSGEIYGIVEAAAFTTDIAETLCVGRRRKRDVDESVFLFVRMAAGRGPLTAELVGRVKRAIREGLSARHVPRFVVEVDEVPVTINGKRVETAVKRIISGGELGQVSSTVANPECLRGFARWVDYEGEEIGRGRGRGRREAKL